MSEADAMSGGCQSAPRRGVPGAKGVEAADARETGRRWLLPNRRHAYYVVAPQYTQRSAGIKALHMLCNALNRAGERAFLITRPYSSPENAIHPGLLTPLLTESVIRQDYESGLTPIVIYPEVVSGNPYNAPLAVRYVLNYPGLLGGDREYRPDEFVITYSGELAKAVPNTRMTLFVPASDPDVFSPEPRVPRSGSCFYAGKYREIHGGALFDITRDSVEIHRQPPLAQSPEEIADLFRRSEIFYTYENTALAIEALLCECPVVFLPNEHLTQVIAAQELGWDGMAWGSDEAEVARAKASVNQGRENFLSLFDGFVHDLRRFIDETQRLASETKYESPISIQFPRLSGMLHLLTEKAELFFHIKSERGGFVAFKRAMNKLFRVLLNK